MTRPSQVLQFQYAGIGNDSAPYNCSLWPGVEFRVLAYQGSGAGEVFSAPSGSTSYSEGTVFQPPPDADGEQPLEVDAPSNLTTSLVDGQVQLNWDYSPSTGSGNQQAELGGFDVWAVDGVNARLIADDTDPNLGPDSTSYTLSPGSLLPGAGEGYLVVTAQPVLDMEVPPYSQFSNAVALPAPNAPTGLTAVATSASTIDVTWTDTNDGTASYQVQRMTIDSGTGGLVGSYQVVATIAPGETTQYVDTVADPLEYIYEVCAVNGASSAYATSLEVTPLPQAPSGVEAVVTSFSQVNVYWQANAVNATGEEVQWATDAGFENIVGTAVVGSEAEEYTVNNLVVGTTYYFRVWADNSSGESAIAGPISTAITGPTLSTASLTLEVNDQGDSGNWMMGDLTGFDGDGSAALDPDSVGGNLRFVELTATIPGWMDLATTAFALDYTGTGFTTDDPTGLRVWDSDSAARNESDYIQPNTDVPVTAFTDSAGSRTLDLWVEALSAGDGDVTLTLVANSDGNGNEDADTQPQGVTQPATNSGTASTTTNASDVLLSTAPTTTAWTVTPNNRVTPQSTPIVVPSLNNTPVTVSVSTGVAMTATRPGYQTYNDGNAIAIQVQTSQGTNGYPPPASYGFIQFMSGLVTYTVKNPNGTITPAPPVTGTLSVGGGNFVFLRGATPIDDHTKWRIDTTSPPYYSGVLTRGAGNLTIYDEPILPFANFDTPILAQLKRAQSITLTVTFQTYLICGQVPVFMVPWTYTETFNPSGTMVGTPTIAVGPGNPQAVNTTFIWRQQARLLGLKKNQ